MNVHSHPLVAGPVFATHSFDLQNFPAGSTSSDNFAQLAHVGPPGINVEVKLVGLDDVAVESGADPAGMLLVRGPPVGSLIGGGGENEEENVDVSGGREYEKWARTGERARVLKNGTFKIL